MSVDPAEVRRLALQISRLIGPLDPEVALTALGAVVQTVIVAGWEPEGRQELAARFATLLHEGLKVRGLN